MKRVNIKLRDDVHTKAKVISVLQNTTLNDFIEKAIENALEQNKAVLEQLKKKI